MYSPFVTGTLMLIAASEAELHHEYRRAMSNATDDEQRLTYGTKAVHHGETAQFFLQLVEQRFQAQQDKNVTP